MKNVNSFHLVAKLRSTYYDNLLRASFSSIRQQEIYMLCSLGTNFQEELTSPYIRELQYVVLEKYNAHKSKSNKI